MQGLYKKRYAIFIFIASTFSPWISLVFFLRYFSILSCLLLVLPNAILVFAYRGGKQGLFRWQSACSISSVDVLCYKKDDKNSVESP